ncbi:hypothetical protein GCM10023093_05640 [Nemorincola caseinilytica]|uniref:Lipoprotein n=2 Tax=Nemorincola caseinilytica TaxID=2054315 RepID=A0ABP8N4P3_9BACT
MLGCFMLTACDTEAARKKVSAAPAAKKDTVVAAPPAAAPEPPPPPTLDTATYNALTLHMVHDSASAKWPVKTGYPLPGALLPFHRIVAYYGNFYSTRMGILGEIEPESMLKKLQGEVAKWQEADSSVKVIPALHYIVVSAQGQPGKAGMYRLRMPFTQIDKTLELAAKINAIVFLDIQVGLSTLQKEIPELERYLALPNVHLAVDPEFSMKTGKVPGSVIGTFDAADLNYASEYLAELVKKNDLPPKILVVHRFTKGMVTNYKNIALRPEVQIVMDMDGWGFPAKKVNSYKLAVSSEPVQFTGFKLFYKNDIKTPPWNTIMSPKDVLKLYPKPMYIQYQ